MKLSEWPWSRIRGGTTKRLTRAVLSTALRPAVALPLERLGHGEDARFVPSGVIEPGDVCYCVGVGVSVSFDLALIDLGCRVYSFDPTPQSIEYMDRLDYDVSRLTFVPVGVWSSDTQLTFHAPANKASPNWSVMDVHSTSEVFHADCRRLATLKAEYAHDAIGLIKLDVEGAWEGILDDMLASGVSPKVLAVEFDSPTSIRKVRRMVRRLSDEGDLLLAHFAREDYLFVRADSIPRDRAQ